MRIAANVALPLLISLAGCGPYYGYGYAAEEPTYGYTDYREPPATMQAAAQTTVTVELFYEELAPYGDWMQHAELGWVWAPHDASYVPYSNGHWEYTEHGFTWISKEPFGWAVCHYGRWVMLDRWVWVPGTEWGPAWVLWREGMEVAGWAPMPPAGFPEPSRDVFVFVDYSYLFVEEAHHHYYTGWEAYDAYGATSWVDERAYASGGVSYCPGPSPDRLRGRGVAVHVTRPDARRTGRVIVRTSPRGRVDVRRPSARPAVDVRRPDAVARGTVDVRRPGRRHSVVVRGGDASYEARRAAVGVTPRESARPVVIRPAPAHDASRGQAERAGVDARFEVEAGRHAADRERMFVRTDAFSGTTIHHAEPAAVEAQHGAAVEAQQRVAIEAQQRHAFEAQQRAAAQQAQQRAAFEAQYRAAAQQAQLRANVEAQQRQAFEAQHRAAAQQAQQRANAEAQHRAAAQQAQQRAAARQVQQRAAEDARRRAAEQARHQSRPVPRAVPRGAVRVRGRR